VAGQGQGSGAAPAQRLDRAGVRGQPPAGSRRRVDGLPDERVPEREPPPVGDRSHQVQGGQLVERGQHVQSVAPDQFGDDHRVERFAQHRRRVEDLTRAAGGRLYLADQADP
jgi:hypothetical protein